MESIEAGNIVGACLLDLNAAFDVVDHSLLMKKLKLYGFDDGSLGWVNSYLEFRSQCVSVEGCCSKLLPVDTGVPQGSILGPLLYTIFTNELPNILDNYVDSSICCYADDTTVSCTAKTETDLTVALTKQFKMVTSFMTDNGLKVNGEKTQLLVMGRKSRDYVNSVHIETQLGSINPSSSVKLLGCSVHESLKWNNHLVGDSTSVKAALNRRIGSIMKMKKLVGFKTRKMIAEGVFMSKASYLISLWCGCATNIKKELQILQNKVARIVTRRDWSTPTRDLLRQCGWLSISQLGIYHSLLQVHKVKLSKRPSYLHNMHHGEHYVRNTRQAEDQQIRLLGNPRLELTRGGFRWQAAFYYNRLPKEIRQMETLDIFKKHLKTWIQENMDII